MNISSKESVKKWTICLCVLLASLLIIYIAIENNANLNRVFHSLTKNRHKMFRINIGYLKAYILSYGKFAAVIFLFIYALKPLLLIAPTSLLSIAAGTVFGPLKATILSMVGCFLAGTFAFYLGRILGKPFVDKLLKGKSLKLDSDIEKHGFRIMFIMRAATIFPYDPLSYAAGLSKMKYKDFILGTLLGILPEMIGYSFMGENIHKPFSLHFFLPIIIVVIIALVSSYYFNLYKKKKQNV